MIEAHSPFTYHPCWSDCRDSRYERVHLPVAPRCNLRCRFCTPETRSACHTQSPRPGSAERVMTVEQAYSRLIEELSRRPRLQVVAVSGPGEPLYNAETFRLLQMISQSDLNVHLCLSTNGVLLAQYVELLSQSCVETVSVSIHTCNVDTATRIYKWAIADHRVLTGQEMGEYIIQNQLQGIEQAADAGIHIKVNTVFIPGINSDEIVSVARAVSERGATLQNVMPLRPCGELSSCRPPTSEEVNTARDAASTYIRQFNLCAGCRSDVIGVPGTDIPL